MKKSPDPSKQKIKFLEKQFEELCLYLQKLLFNAPDFDSAREVLVIKREIERHLADKLRLAKDLSTLSQIHLSNEKGSK